MIHLTFVNWCSLTFTIHEFWNYNAMSARKNEKKIVDKKIINLDLHQLIVFVICVFDLSVPRKYCRDCRLFAIHNDDLG